VFAPVWEAPSRKDPLMMYRLIRDDRGQGLVEYALIIALVSVLAIAALQFLGQKASNTLSNAATYLS
jgi:pilus assembly protein Flp/PilA